MGSSRTFTWQCIALVAIVVVFALVAPVESKFWVMLTGLPAAAFFIVVSLARHQQIKRLAGETTKCSTMVDVSIFLLRAKATLRCSRTSCRRWSHASHERPSSSKPNAMRSQIRSQIYRTASGHHHGYHAHAASSIAENETERKRAVRKLESMIERVSQELVIALLKIAKDDGRSRCVSNRKPSSCAETIRRAIAPLEPALDLHDVSLVVRS